MLTDDQWRLLDRACSPLTIARLLTDFESEKASCVRGCHQGSWTLSPNCWFETEARGLYVYGPYPAPLPTDEECTTTAEWKQWQRDNSRPVLIDLPWTLVRRWADAQPAAVVGQARAHLAEWGAICRERDRYRRPGHMGPSWADCHTHPLTQEAAHEVECQRREDRLTADVRAWADSLAPDDEPTDLLELLAAGAS